MRNMSSLLPERVSSPLLFFPPSLRSKLSLERTQLRQERARALEEGSFISTHLAAL